MLGSFAGSRVPASARHSVASCFSRCGLFRSLWFRCHAPAGSLVSPLRCRKRHLRVEASLLLERRVRRPHNRASALHSSRRTMPHAACIPDSSASRETDACRHLHPSCFIQPRHDTSRAHQPHAQQQPASNIPMTSRRTMPHHDMTSSRAPQPAPSHYATHHTAHITPHNAPARPSPTSRTRRPTPPRSARERSDRRRKRSFLKRTTDRRPTERTRASEASPGKRGQGGGRE